MLRRREGRADHLGERVGSFAQTSGKARNHRAPSPAQMPAESAESPVCGRRSVETSARIIDHPDYASSVPVIERSGPVLHGSHDWATRVLRSDDPE